VKLLREPLVYFLFIGAVIYLSYAAFAESLTGLSPGQWHGPLLSGYGTHLVYVHNVVELPAQIFATLIPLCLFPRLFPRFSPVHS